MKTTGLLLLGMFIAMPVAAQEAEDAAAYEDAAAAYADGASADAASEDAYADSTAADDAAAFEGSGSAPADDAAAFEDSGSAPADDAAAFEDSGSAPADDAAAFEDSGSAPADDAAAFADSGSGDTSAADFADTGSADESADGADSAPAEDYDPAAAFANDSTESYSAPPQATPGAAAYGAEPYAADSGSDAYGSDDGYGDSASEASSEPERDPIRLYAGADYAWLTASLSSDQLKAKFGGDEFDSRFYRARFGTRLFGKIGVEGQFGFSDTDDTEPGDVEVSEYVGVFIVPTGVIFDLIEVAAPIGYSVTELSGRGASHKFDGFSFGLNFEIPLLIDVENFPDIRIGGGGTVYQAEREARVYGYHAGIRFDFNI